MGIPGIIVMVFIFAAVIHQYWRLYQSNHRVAQWLAACGIAMVFGVLTRNMTDDFFHRDLALLFWSLVGASLGYGSRLVGKK
jgi:O-antigen ligase